jgi:hypothetical protein
MEVDIWTWIKVTFPIGRRVRVTHVKSGSRFYNAVGVVSDHARDSSWPIWVDLGTEAIPFSENELEPLD